MRFEDNNDSGIAITTTGFRKKKDVSGAQQIIADTAQLWLEYARRSDITRSKSEGVREGVHATLSMSSPRRIALSGILRKKPRYKRLDKNYKPALSL